jgi:hypothetical protein
LDDALDEERDDGLNGRDDDGHKGVSDGIAHCLHRRLGLLNDPLLDGVHEDRRGGPHEEEGGGGRDGIKVGISGHFYDDVQGGEQKGGEDDSGDGTDDPPLKQKGGRERDQGPLVPFFGGPADDGEGGKTVTYDGEHSWLGDRELEGKSKSKGRGAATNRKTLLPLREMSSTRRESDSGRPVVVVSLFGWLSWSSFQEFELVPLLSSVAH